MRQDITMYSEGELSMQVLNEKGLYKAFKELKIFKDLVALLDELFIYTDEQLEDLEYDFDNDLI